MISRLLTALGLTKSADTAENRQGAKLESAPARTLPDVESADSADDHQYLSDQPIERSAQDRFNRAPFARRIADTIAKRTDPSSIVIGLFAPWGDGKTSVLGMMQESLEGHEHVITIRFNPWHFASEELVLRGFFATLADALGKKLPNFKEKAGALLQRYGAVLSLASVSLGGVVEIKPGEAAKGLGDSLSSIGLDELKARIEALLAESGKRVVVLIDDIDRLDRDETHSIFKLVKLSASFKHTCYVLAFDDDVVSAALGQRYGAGSAEAGRSFLEKIIQVPLHLPPPDKISLRELTFEGVNAALKQADISIKQERVDAFVRHFVDGLEPKLETPRLAKLYTNALTFSLPLLKGEVDTADLMLIEGIRVFYPKLYAAIRANPDMFLQGEQEQRRHGLDRGTSALDELLEGCIPNSTQANRVQIKDRLLKPLFPRTGNMIYGREWDRDWAIDQRACAAQYFPRFFAYGVPDGDIPDMRVRAVIDALALADADAAREQLEQFQERRAMPRLIRVLRAKVDDLTQQESAAVGRAIAHNGDLLPVERGPMEMGGTRMQGGILIRDLLRHLMQGEVREREARAFIGDSRPLAFGLECLRWMMHSTDKPEEERLLPEAVEHELKDILADRIRAANDAEPLYLAEPRDAPALYWIWQDARGREAVADALQSRFDAHPAEVDIFLDRFVGEGWEIESGLPRRSDLDRRAYDNIIGVIAPELLLTNLKQRYGATLDTPQYDLGDRASYETRFAHQFVYIHNAVTQSNEALNSPHA
jgi:hypothetical protein